MSNVRLSIPDELQLYIREQLARIDQLHAEADRKRQESSAAPLLLRIEVWKAASALIAAGVGLVVAAAAVLKLVS